MHDIRWKVGQLARRTGLSIRTLHYYDQIGLLNPSHRTEAGYRLYGHADVTRLQQIGSLRQLGLSLEQIREFLQRPDFVPQQTIELHIEHLKRQIRLQQDLCKRLETVAERFRSAEAVSVEDFLQTIEAMTMFEKYYTKEQLAQLEARRQQLGDDQIRKVEAEWPELIAKVRAEKDKGTDPSSEVARKLAKRWHELVEMFTGGDTGIRDSLKKMYKAEPQVQNRYGLDEDLVAYVAKASAAAKKG